MNEKKYYINTLIINEFENNKKLIDSYKLLISKLIKGSLFIKTVNNKKYCYIKYREDTKIVLKYVGTEDLVDELKSQIEQRKHYEKIIKKLEEENKHIIRMVNVR